VFVALSLTLDCTPDEAWDLIRSPRGFAYASAPLARFTPVEPRAFPERWTPGARYRARMLLGGLVPVGDVVIHTTHERVADARVVVDDGGPVSQPMASVSPWRHRMAVSAAPGGRTRFRDRLDVTGPIAPLMWAGLWVFWQWRGVRIRRLAARWRDGGPGTAAAR